MYLIKLFQCIYTIDFTFYELTCCYLMSPSLVENQSMNITAETLDGDLKSLFLIYCNKFTHKQSVKYLNWFLSSQYFGIFHCFTCVIAYFCVSSGKIHKHSFIGSLIAFIQGFILFNFQSRNLFPVLKIVQVFHFLSARFKKYFFAVLYKSKLIYESTHTKQKMTSHFCYTY